MDTRNIGDTFFFRLESISPVHIGTGETLDACSYVIKDNTLFIIDLDRWIADYPDKKKLCAELSRGLWETRRFISREIDAQAYAIRSGPVEKTIAKKYEEELNRHGSENRLELAPAMATPFQGNLIIPGSSLKGAIRTPLLDWAVGEKGRNGRDYDERHSSLSKDVFGDIKNNAMKYLKLSDCTATLARSQFVEAKEVREEPSSKPGTPKTPCEVIEAASVLYGTMQFKNFSVIAQGKKEEISKEKLVRLCNAFYTKRYTDEYEKFYTKEHLKKVTEHLESVMDIADDEILLRVGHYSHIECMTITDNKPKTRKIPRSKPEKFYPHGTTRTLANGVQPFGWVKLCFIGEEEYTAGLEGQKEADRQCRTQWQAALKAAQEVSKQAKQKHEKALHDMQAQEAERAEIENRIEQAPDEEKEILRLELGRAANPPETIAKIRKNFDTLPEALQQRAAQALWKYWEGTKEGRPKNKEKRAFYDRIKAMVGE